MEINNQNKYFSPELHPKLKHKKKGTVSWVTLDMEGKKFAGSKFFITLDDNLDFLDQKHCVFGKVVEGLEVLDKANDLICDLNDKPFTDFRINHVVVLDDPFPDPKNFREPSRSPSPTPSMLNQLRIDKEFEAQKNLTEEELEKLKRKENSMAQAFTLELVGDLPFAEVKPPENVLFVCKLNPVTMDEDLEMIFGRFGPILSCEVIRDQKTNDSLCYAFIEFENKEDAEMAYFKMDNVLIDDRRIKVDFSQSVSKLGLGGQYKKEKEMENTFQKRTRYKDQKEEEEYEMVFEKEGMLDEEKLKALKKQKILNHNEYEDNDNQEYNKKNKSSYSKDKDTSSSSKRDDKHKSDRKYDDDDRYKNKYDHHDDSRYEKRKNYSDNNYTSRHSDRSYSEKRRDYDRKKR
ncbi:Peptidyl-prolyl cis-trans isomerase cyp6 [Lobulomyces angularis]|nr:Peptidyl-prolyl cis-trans isomerase cyp6 [Lobulomyces angularis]